MSITPLADAAVDRVLAYGAKKHSDSLFEDGCMKYTVQQRISKASTHFMSGYYGEKDPETGEDAFVHCINQLKMIVEMRGRLEAELKAKEE